MLSITIIVVGSFKESYWRDAEAEYQKRLSPYVRLTIKEVPEEPFKDAADRVRILAQEEKRVMACIPRDAVVILCDREGKEYSSEAFADLIAREGEGGTSLCFIIGGPLGTSETLRAAARHRLSWGALTLPHQLARIVLHEQIYRAVTILKQKPYHY